MEANPYFGYCKWFAKASALQFALVGLTYFFVIAFGDAIFGNNNRGSLDFLATVSAWLMFGGVATGIISGVFFLVAKFVEGYRGPSTIQLLTERGLIMADQSPEEQLAYCQGRALACRTAFEHIIDVYFQDTPNVKFVHRPGLAEELTARLNEELLRITTEVGAEAEPSPAFTRGFQEELGELVVYASIPH